MTKKSTPLPEAAPASVVLGEILMVCCLINEGSHLILDTQRLTLKKQSGLNAWNQENIIDIPWRNLLIGDDENTLDDSMIIIT